MPEPIVMELDMDIMPPVLVSTSHFINPVYIRNINITAFQISEANP
jgi:hypothetical protein